MMNLNGLGATGKGITPPKEEVEGNLFAKLLEKNDLHTGLNELEITIDGAKYTISNITAKVASDPSTGAPLLTPDKSGSLTARIKWEIEVTSDLSPDRPPLEIEETHLLKAMVPQHDPSNAMKFATWELMVYITSMKMLCLKEFDRKLRTDETISTLASNKLTFTPDGSKVNIRANPSAAKLLTIDLTTFKVSTLATEFFDISSENLSKRDDVLNLARYIDYLSTQIMTKNYSNPEARCAKFQYALEAEDLEGLTKDILLEKLKDADIKLEDYEKFLKTEIRIQEDEIERHLNFFSDNPETRKEWMNAERVATAKSWNKTKQAAAYIGNFLAKVTLIPWGITHALEIDTSFSQYTTRERIGPSFKRDLENIHRDREVFGITRDEETYQNYVDQINFHRDAINGAIKKGEDKHLLLKTLDDNIETRENYEAYKDKTDAQLIQLRTKLEEVSPYVKLSSEITLVQNKKNEAPNIIELVDARPRGVVVTQPPSTRIKSQSPTVVGSPSVIPQNPTANEEDVKEISDFIVKGSWMRPGFEESDRKRFLRMYENFQDLDMPDPDQFENLLKNFLSKAYTEIDIPNFKPTPVEKARILETSKVLLSFGLTTDLETLINNFKNLITTESSKVTVEQPKIISEKVNSVAPAKLPSNRQGPSATRKSNRKKMGVGALSRPGRPKPPPPPTPPRPPKSTGSPSSTTPMSTPPSSPSPSTTPSSPTSTPLSMPSSPLSMPSSPLSPQLPSVNENEDIRNPNFEVIPEEELFSNFTNKNLSLLEGAQIVSICQSFIQACREKKRDYLEGVFFKAKIEKHLEFNLRDLVDYVRHNRALEYLVRQMQDSIETFTYLPNFYSSLKESFAQSLPYKVADVSIPIFEGLTYEEFEQSLLSPNPADELQIPTAPPLSDEASKRLNESSSESSSPQHIRNLGVHGVSNLKASSASKPPDLSIENLLKTSLAQYREFVQDEEPSIDPNDDEDFD
jgi:hypothetical protein